MSDTYLHCAWAQHYRPPEANHLANRKKAQLLRPEANRGERQLSFAVRDTSVAIDGQKLALHISPPRNPVSAVRRLDLAARWATELVELAAELVTEGKLEVERTQPAARTTERTR